MQKMLALVALALLTACAPGPTHIPTATPAPSPTAPTSDWTSMGILKPGESLPVGQYQVIVGPYLMEPEIGTIWMEGDGTGCSASVYYDRLKDPVPLPPWKGVRYWALGQTLVQMNCLHERGVDIAVSEIK